MGDIMHTYEMVVVCFLLFINGFGFFLMGLDKTKAKHGWWRIKEQTLLGVACLFGSYGIYAGMKAFHHKTNHKSFSITVPICIIVHTCVLVAFFIGSGGIS